MDLPRAFQKIASLLKGVNPKYSKLIVFIFTALILSLMLSTTFSDILRTSVFSQGEVASYTVRSPGNLHLEDTLSTEKRRASAMATVPRVFTMPNDPQESIDSQLEELLVAVQELERKTVGGKPQAKASERGLLEKSFGVNFVGEEWNVLLDRALFPNLKEDVRQIALPILDRGIIANKRHLENALLTSLNAVLYMPKQALSRDLESEGDFYTPEEAQSVVGAAFPVSGFGRGRVYDSLVQKLVRMLLKPNVFFDSKETEKRLLQAQQSVEPVYYRVKRGEVLVRAGDVVTAAQERRLRQINELFSSAELLKRWAAYLLLCVVVLYAVFSFVVTFWPQCKPKPQDIAIGSLTLIGSFFLIKIFAMISSSLNVTFYAFDPGTFVLTTPLAAGGILLQVTLGAPAVLIFVISFAMLAGVFLDNSWVLMVMIVVGNIVGAATVKTCCRRSSFLRAGARVAFLNILVVLCFVLLFPDYSFHEVINRILWAFVGGLFSGVLAAGLTPLVEALGGYVTDIKLLELASLDHPLLRELSVQAPGTWTHSMLLGQMSEAGAEAIGANPLLARVGAYYHDIGKMKKPAYFVENQHRENPHDKLSPSMSVLIIKSHVKDGMDLAEEHRLPQAVADFIPQHHGTALIKYFYDKALKEADDDEVVDESHYRYHGPRPQTKECAILMLADSVEAASRTLSEPTPAKVQGLVQKIINSVFVSGELDSSNLTLKELHLIAKAFIRVLNSIYHRRIEYSEPAEKIREAKQSKPSKPTATTESEQPAAADMQQGAVRSGAENGNGKKDGENSAGKSASKDNKETLKRLGI